MELANDLFLNSIKQLFDEALDEGNYVLAQEKITVLKEEGFETEAKQLHNVLMEATLGDFLVESKID